MGTRNYDDFDERTLRYDVGHYDETRNYDDYDVGDYDETRGLPWMLPRVLGLLMVLLLWCIRMSRWRPKPSHLQLKPSRLLLKYVLKMVQARGRLPLCLR